jgi:hypothetical protein
VAKTPAVATDSPDPATLDKLPQAIPGNTKREKGEPRRCWYLLLRYEAIQKENEPERVTENVTT